MVIIFLIVVIMIVIGIMPSIIFVNFIRIVHILFDISNIEQDDSICILDYKVDNSGRILTFKNVFYEIVGKKLEIYGFKVMKGRYPYIVRVINNEILHVITCVDEMPDYPGNKGYDRFLYTKHIMA